MTETTPTNEQNQDPNSSESQARAQLASIVEMVTALRVARGDEEPTITDFEVIRHGIDHPQYFPGCGVANTKYSEIETGVSTDDERSAFDEALDQLACSAPFRTTFDLSALEQWADEQTWNEDNPVDAMLADEGSEYQYYVSIRYDVPEIDEDEARQTIEEDALSVEVRDSTWHTPGDTDYKPDEFCILLCTGGPAVRIIGDLDEHNQPERPRLEHQDWFTGWQELVDITSEERAALLEYCQCFYFGE